MKQIGLKKIKGQIVVETGLHIGAGNDVVEIGGIDMPVVRNPVTPWEPYIPGSSIKGKMRSLLEWEFKKVQSTGDNMGKPCGCGEPKCEICRVFGSSSSGRKEDEEKSKQRGPTRLIIRDSFVSDDSIKEIFDKGRSFFEDKRENTIDRITAKANPRHLERVVPGVKFDFELVYRVIDTGDDGKTDEDFFETVVKKGLALLQNDYLGGGGTRGNGRIKFTGLKEFTDSKDETGREISL